jgi:hypothetical protein
MKETTDSARHVANALSEGINCLYEIMVGEGCTPREPELDDAGTSLDDSLCALEAAMSELRNGTFEGGPVVTDDDLRRVQRIRLLVTEWNSDQGRSAELSLLCRQCLESLFGNRGLELLDRQRDSGH